MAAGGGVVLVVDDDPDILEITREILIEEVGCQVYTAANGYEALAQLARMPRPALILLDLMMPGMSGEELLGELQANDVVAGIPVVIVSAAPVESVAGATRILRKPFAYDALLALVRAYCG
jgi:putative two-component system response regulator